MLPLVSIIIVNYNGIKWIKPCLDSLLQQNYKNFEIIFVDNASNDGSSDFVKKHYKKVTLVENASNSGFSGGNNAGMRYAKGEFVLLLNNDITVEKDFLTSFMNVFEKIPSASIAQSKIILMRDMKTIDTCGSFWTDTSFLYHVGNGKNESLKQYNQPFQVFSVKGASMLIKRSVIDKIGLFDDDTWCYYEETDFCHRAWLAGYESWYWPHAKVYHAQGGTSLTFNNDFVQFHNFKNKLLSFLKNFEGRNLLSILPVYIVINLCISMLWIIQMKFPHVFSLYKSIGWNLMHMRSTIRKRRIVQRLRKKSDKEIFSVCRRSPRISYYWYLFTDTIKNYEDHI